MQIIKMPRERVGVLIGTDGTVKKEIEERSGILVEVDSETGEVTLYTEKTEEPVMVLKVTDIINAISCGFSSDRAFRLFYEDVYFASFDIRNYVGKNAKHVQRIRARMIGSEGKTRRIIEDLTGAEISVYENNVGIIGDINEIEIAKNSVDMILNGSEHSSVYRYLEGKRRQMKRRRIDW